MKTILLFLLLVTGLHAQTWTPQMESLAKSTEAQYNLPRGICKAFARVESSYDSTATREENHYFNDGGSYSVAVKKASVIFLSEHPSYGNSLTIERAQRTISVGLFQFMGQLLRDLGYSAEDIDPTVEEQFHYFGIFTAKNRARWSKTTDWIAAYNAGSPRIKNGHYVNQGYVNKILKAWHK